MAIRHQHRQDAHVGLFGGDPPQLEIESGDSVSTQTVDSFGRDENDRRVSVYDNPLTGPFFVSGAMPGDCLAVRIDRLEPNRSFALSVASIVEQAVDPAFVVALPLSRELRWQLDSESGDAILDDPQIGPLRVAQAPMLGCIGVAPGRRQAIWSGTSGRHGGNLDCRRVRAGSTVYLPVYEPGALLSLGDGHAAQAAGEIAGTGLEISMDVDFTVSVVKGRSIGWPRGEDSESIWTIGCERGLLEALQHATTELVRWLCEGYGIASRRASVIVAQCVDYEVCNVCNPAYTVACVLPRAKLELY